MDKHVKKLWLAALRDGSFKKARHAYQLRNLKDEFDVTGVLCELAVIEGIIDAPIKVEAKNSDFKGYSYGDEKYATGLPKAVVEWAGIDYRTAYSFALRTTSDKNFDGAIAWLENKL